MKASFLMSEYYTYDKTVKNHPCHLQVLSGTFYVWRKPLPKNLIHNIIFSPCVSVCPPNFHRASCPLW